MQTWLSDQIALDPAVCHGKPVVRGTRVLVANVVGAIAAGQSHREILVVPRVLNSIGDQPNATCFELRVFTACGPDVRIAPRQHVYCPGSPESATHHAYCAGHARCGAEAQRVGSKTTAQLELVT